MKQVIWTRHSAQDLFEIGCTIAEDNEDAAYKTLDGIRRQAMILAGLPKLGRSRNNLVFGLRSFPIGTYMIFYQIIDTGIEVIRVLHGARDTIRIFKVI